MKSKAIERVEVLYNSQTWYVKLQIWFALQKHEIHCVGLKKYIAYSLKL